MKQYSMSSRVTYTPAPPQQVPKPTPRKGVRKLRKTPIVATTATLKAMLDAHPDQVIHAYKIIKAGHLPAYRTGYDFPPYLVGSVHEEPNANTHKNTPCARGLNVCTLEWALIVFQHEVRNLYNDDMLATVEFKRSDVACFPRASNYANGKFERGDFRNGKFRVFRHKVIAVRTLTKKETAYPARVLNGPKRKKRTAELLMHSRIKVARAKRDDV